MVFANQLLLGCEHFTGDNAFMSGNKPGQNPTAGYVRRSSGEAASVVLPNGLPESTDVSPIPLGLKTREFELIPTLSKLLTTGVTAGKMS